LQSVRRRIADQSGNIERDPRLGGEYARALSRADDRYAKQWTTFRAAWRRGAACRRWRVPARAVRQPRTAILDLGAAGDIVRYQPAPHAGSRLWRDVRSADR